VSGAELLTDEMLYNLQMYLLSETGTLIYRMPSEVKLLKQKPDEHKSPKSSRESPWSPCGGHVDGQAVCVGKDLWNQDRN